MIITIHCGGMPFNGDTIREKSLGGSETAAYYIAKELAARGHKVTLFTNHQSEGVFEGVKYVWAGDVSERAPLGDRFHFYAMNTPVDVMVIQRQPGAFAHKWSSKLNVCWLHDLALHRHAQLAMSGAWNIDSIFTVSEFHKKQIIDVWGFDKDLIRPVTNGVDLNLFKGKARHSTLSAFAASRVAHQSAIAEEHKQQIKFLYSSRPERGLVHLVREGGIMEKLLAIDPRFHLYVCNYENNVPQMADLYNYLYQRIAQLPNCTMVGHLPKRELADVMRECDALVYPTEFEEVSCITAMEAMAAGLPFISSKHAALPETCSQFGQLGGALIPLKEDGTADEDAFVLHLQQRFLGEDPKKIADIDRAYQLAAAEQYSWSKAAERFEKHFEELFAERIQSPEAVLQNLIYNSDYYAAEEFFRQNLGGFPPGLSAARREMDECYAFARNRTWKEHYEAYYEYEKNRGVVYGPEDLSNNSRYNLVASDIGKLPAGSVVLDYGCAHGHYTVNLARRFPNLRFVGVDIARSNVEAARKWAADEGLTNVEFFNGAVGESGLEIFEDPSSAVALNSFHCIIVAEVLEHVESPAAIIDTLAPYLTVNGMFLTTTPVGPWEAAGYEEHWPWRAHVHHLEREDLHDLFGHHPKFRINLTISGADKRRNVLGSYIAVFGKPKEKSRTIDYARKLRQLNPTQTLAVCIIARDAEMNIGRTLESVKDIADEIIVGVDRQTKDGTREIAVRYVKGYSPTSELLFDIDSPLDTGFDAARNTVIAKAKADWILWIDSDEVLFHPERVIKYLRKNQFNGYAVKQIHYSVEPACVMKVDFPTRLFRNHQGIKFFGVVHEHPEKELNEGLGLAMLLDDISISHHGYSTEEIRRKRFERNIGLLHRDRKLYPDRQLGKFLWLRDLAQMCRWELEGNGGQVTPVMQARAREGIKIWEELLDANQLRLITELDNLGFYTTLVEILGEGFHFGFKMDVSKLNGGANPDRGPLCVGRFHSKEHAQKLFIKMLDDRTAKFDSKYF